MLVLLDDCPFVIIFLKVSEGQSPDDFTNGCVCLSFNIAVNIFILQLYFSTLQFSQFQVQLHRRVLPICRVPIHSRSRLFPS